MAKVKYYYDSETLSYRKIERKKGRRFGIIAISLLGSFLAGFILLLIYLNIPELKTPREKSLVRELENMQLQYQVLDKKMDQTQDVLANIEKRDNNIYRAYFEADPIPAEERQAGFGGINRYENLEGYSNSDLIVHTSREMDKLQKRLVVESKSLDEITALAEKKQKLLKAIPAIQPLKNEDLSRVSAGYGMRWHPILKIKRMHKGMDFAAPVGAEVYATGDGVIEKASRGHGYGKKIEIDHGFGYETDYAHLSEFNVRRGDKVKRGEVIGYIGNSGLSTGSHLHYEIRKNDKPINPVNYFHGDLTAKEYEIMLKKANMATQSLD
jgi:murein DD-endopeptidase MepM/ murein hydrolase activator NlpD